MPKQEIARSYANDLKIQHSFGPKQRLRLGSGQNACLCFLQTVKRGDKEEIPLRRPWREALSAFLNRGLHFEAIFFDFGKQGGPGHSQQFGCTRAVA